MEKATVVRCSLHFKEGRQSTFPELRFFLQSAESGKNKYSPGQRHNLLQAMSAMELIPLWQWLDGPAIISSPFLPTLVQESYRLHLQ